MFSVILGCYLLHWCLVLSNWCYKNMVKWSDWQLRLTRDWSAAPRNRIWDTLASSLDSGRKQRLVPQSLIIVYNLNTLEAILWFYNCQRSFELLHIVDPSPQWLSGSSEVSVWSRPTLNNRGHFSNDTILAMVNFQSVFSQQWNPQVIYCKQTQITWWLQW